MRRSLVALGITVVVGAVAIFVAVSGSRAVSGTPVAGPQHVAPPEAATPRCDAGPELDMSGSPLASVAIDQLGSSYDDACPNRTTDNYEPVGTGAGIQRFTTNETDVAITDRPLNETERRNAGNRCHIQQLPFVALPVTIRYRLPVVANLTLDAPTLAKIFSGAITQWNDPAITALNPKAGLGALPITVVARSTASTVTAVFQRYLTAVGGWTTGDDSAFTGRSTLSARTEAETLSLIDSTDGAIGYLLPVDSTGSSTLRLSGVTPDLSTVAGGIDLALPNTGLELDTDKLYRAGPPEGAYPLVIVNYAVFCENDQTARDFLRSALTAGLAEDDYLFPVFEWATRYGDALQ